MFVRSLLGLLLLSATACGPEPLPAFANPPPVDAAVEDDADAGTDSEVR